MFCCLKWSTKLSHLVLHCSYLLNSDQYAWTSYSQVESYVLVTRSLYTCNDVIVPSYYPYLGVCRLKERITLCWKATAGTSLPLERHSVLILVEGKHSCVSY